MAIQVSNIYSYPANRGAAVRVTLSASEAVNKLPSIYNGEKATISSSGNFGYVCSVDIYGNSFQVNPRNPDLRFESNTPGYLNAGEIITLI
jgi:hypothetical protein